MPALTKAIVGVLLVSAIGLLAGGVSLLVQRDTGTRAKATVAECTHSGGSRNYTTHCTGSWVVGGDLVGGNGHVVVGTINGADSGDVGKTVDVTVSGNRAQTRSLLLPILLIGLGLLVAAGGVVLIRAGVKARARPSTIPLGLDQPGDPA
jgi:hypothetical protein